MSIAELLVGDAAPKLELAEFLEGEPVDGFAPGTTTVVEFWAPWCGPCVSGIPHLSALQARYPQVVVLGVAVQPWGDVQGFVRGQGDAMAYRVALDAPPAEGRRTGPTHRAWCDASFQTGIPASFIVDGGGRVAWIGHPMELDEPLAAIVEGRWDLAAEAEAEAYRDRIVRTKVRETARMFEEASRCGKAEDRAGVVRAFDETFAAHPELERKYSTFKLRALFSLDQAEAVTYARHLIAAAPGGDETPFSVGSVLCGLVQGDLDAKKPVDPAVAAFAVEAMLQAEHAVLTQCDGAAERVWVLTTLAQALLTAGQADAAQARARAARDLAETAGLEAARLARIDALLERCAAAAPMPEMVCADGVCRIGPA
ncbi:TlpA family protein disulfide reductase [Methylobacterium sp. E-025]|uniref:TlpA family protein disulfide reductase n=1 Tax=Methylobacterium sp. E-025 TaxID=2836561 RepID=UPI001FBBF2F3|nr:TlpA disulfide reductase family protein [Methylobacterium sp. E-025]MCJ2111883.1 TlpA family protein disulfide reductase [Methylobacterium sp. E-025]